MNEGDSGAINVRNGKPTSQWRAAMFPISGTLPFALGLRLRSKHLCQQASIRKRMGPAISCAAIQPAQTLNYCNGFKASCLVVASCHTVLTAQAISIELRCALFPADCSICLTLQKDGNRSAAQDFTTVQGFA